MPKVGVSNEPLLERAIFVYDGTDWRPAKADSSGNLIAAVLADQAVQARGYGWIGGAWQKQPFPFGVSDRYAEALSNTSLAAGTNRLDFAVVPAGEVWVVTAMTVTYVGTIAGVAEGFQVYDGATYYDLWNETPVVSTKTYDRFGQVVLKAGDRLSAYCTSATLNDDFFASALGYKMDVDQ